MTILIAAGFILNGHQIVHNCYIGMTRVMVAMSLDRLLPEMVSRVSRPTSTRRSTPTSSTSWPACRSSACTTTSRDGGDGDGTTTWTSLTLGVTFACGYVFVGTALAGALLPFRAKALYEASPGAAYKVGGFPLVTIVGLVGAVAGVVFLYLFLTNPSSG